MNALTQVVRILGGGLRGRRPPAGEVPTRRATPRVSKRLPVDVLGCRLTSTNVTDTGLQVACPASALGILRAQWDPAATPVQVVLPEGEPIDVVCTVAYVSACDDEFLVGLTFGKLEAAAQTRWQDYLHRLAGGVPVPGT